MKHRSSISPLAMSIVQQHRYARFMSLEEMKREARRLDLRCVNSMTPNPVRLIRWRPKVCVRRHYLTVGVFKIRMTLLTGSEQYAAVLSLTRGDFKWADKLHVLFNRQFDRTKRLSTWTPGKVIT